MIKILTIVGARPQFIKSAAISRAINSHFSDQIHEVILHTGQHYDPNMSKVFFEEMDIPKEKYNLNIGSGNHAEQTAQIMIELDKIVDQENPKVILLYGDTNSTLASCLVAVKRHIPIIHVEAGVRSYNKRFPEEVNRLICDHMSSLLFVPSDAGMDCLEKEGFNVNNSSSSKDLLNAPKVIRCGDIMYDNTLFFMNKADQLKHSVFEKHKLPSSNYILATAHRPSNVDQFETFENILKYFQYVVNELDQSIIFPIHPRTKKFITQNQRLIELITHDKIFVIPAVSFLEMVALEKNANLIVTDSGGVQKEAYFMEKPCLIMLEETPWTELVESNNALLVGSDYDKLCEGSRKFVNQLKPLSFPKLYGNGKASEFICEQIINFIK